VLIRLRSLDKGCSKFLREEEIAHRENIFGNNSKKEYNRSILINPSEAKRT
jgi:hypothetical protein